MKKNLTLLAFLLAIAFHGLAQDTISGVVSRVAAPFFEQNVCDTRFAINTDNETYYVMVDGYWPNPYLEDLVIHYDTIPVGNEIEVVGTIMEMEDGNGMGFYTIVVNENLNSSIRSVLGFFKHNNVNYPSQEPISAASFVKYTGTELYYITINGDLQTNVPLFINGRRLVDDKRYLFIGRSSNWTDYYGNTIVVYEVIDALPIDQEDLIINGILTTENDLCLSWPREEDLYLSVFDGKDHHYVTNKGTLQNIYTQYNIRNAFGNNTPVVAGGFEIVRHDLFGSPFNAIETIKLNTENETTLTGLLTCEKMPYIGLGPQIPGLDMSFFCNGHHYIDNPRVWDSMYYEYLYNAFIVGSDTIYYSNFDEATATFIPNMILNNYRNPIFFIQITEINVFNGIEELDHHAIQVFPNPANDMIYISCPYSSISHIDLFDSRGCLISSKVCDENLIQFNNIDIHGVLFLRIKLSNGEVITKKIIVQ